MFPLLGDKGFMHLLLKGLTNLVKFLLAPGASASCVGCGVGALLCFALPPPRHKIAR